MAAYIRAQPSGPLLLPLGLLQDRMIPRQKLSFFCGCRPGSKRILTSGSDRVRSSVRPHIAALPKAAGRYGDQHDRVQIYSASCRARSPYLVFPILICSIISHIVSVFSLRLASYIGERVMPPPVHLDPDNRCASSAWPKAAGPFCLPVRLPPTSLAFDASAALANSERPHCRHLAL